jgi:CHAT domain-containing protein
LIEVQRSLGPQEALAEYAIGFDEVLAFVVRNDGVDVVRIDATPEELRSKVGVLRQAILRGKENPADDLWRASASSLYRELIQPLKPFLQGKSELIIAPHRFLYRVPFQALIDSAGRPTVEEYSILYVPSASFLVRSRAQQRGSLSKLVALAPEPELRFSKDEAEHIPQDLFSSRTMLVGSEATSDRLLAACREADVVHVASHAHMNNQFPFYSHIHCADRPLELFEVLQENIRPRLVFLSGCETGETVGAVEDEISSENSVSFPRAFISAGATNVIGSLWLADDETASLLARHFYGHLRSTAGSSTSSFPPPLALCLAEAQRQLIAASRVSGKKFHPFYWAPCYLVGDGR